MTRSMGRLRTDYSNPEMNLIGYLVAAPLVILLLPFLPILVLLWIVNKIMSR